MLCGIKSVIQNSSVLCCWLPPQRYKTNRREEKTEVKRRQKRRDSRREEKTEEKREKVSERGRMGPGLPRRWLQQGLLTLVSRSRIPRVPDSGIDTGGTCGPGLARVYWVPEDPRFFRSRNLDASTPLLEERAWTHVQWVGQCSPITEGKTLQSAPLMASATPGNMIQIPKVPGTGEGNSLICPLGHRDDGNGGFSESTGLYIGRPVLHCPNRFTSA